MNVVVSAFACFPQSCEEQVVPDIPHNQELGVAEFATQITRSYKGSITNSGAHTMKAKTLDDMLINEIEKAVQSKSFLVQVVRQHFEKAGLTLTSEQVKSIENQLNISDERMVEIEFSDEEAAALAGRGIDLNQLDLGQIGHDDFNAEVSRVTQEVIKAVIDQSGAALAAEWSTARSDVLAERNQELGKFRVFLHDTWGVALDALEAFIALCVELGEDQFVNGLATMQKVKRDVFARLHARSCQVSNEICTLLRSGFADGAHARWRTLHELVTVGEFLLDAPDQVSKMYVVHADVARAKEAEEFQRRQHSFGYERISDADMAQIIAAKEVARSKFGTDFLKDYGWATQHLKANYNKKRKKRNITSFADIEEATNKSRLRNYYKLANRNVHAGFWGELSRLGNDPKWIGNFLLAGPSHFGLAMPAYNTAYSLGLLTVGLLVHDRTFETLISAKALTLLVMQFNDLVNAADVQAKPD